MRRKEQFVVEDRGEFVRVMVRDAADAVRGASLRARASELKMPPKRGNLGVLANIR